MKKIKSLKESDIKTVNRLDLVALKQIKGGNKLVAKNYLMADPGDNEVDQDNSSIVFDYDGFKA